MLFRSGTVPGRGDSVYARWNYDEAEKAGEPPPTKAGIVNAVIRYFGSRKKIFNVHFRNIRGHRNDFAEVFPDEGSVDFLTSSRA